ncbi:hypothetical protein AMTR_s00161p00053480 [Amborella trichopoda]|uniref:Uncharacterized protein n=1 Tax=Amborella trichopoda TaxID=13333 RepID=W1PRL4_AMBTC|nr:hypothetical protein AMTR_s00161p00053480 [Amborella trichopoda]
MEDIYNFRLWIKSMLTWSKSWVWTLEKLCRKGSFPEDNAKFGNDQFVLEAIETVVGEMVTAKSKGKAPMKGMKFSTRLAAKSMARKDAGRSTCSNFEPMILSSDDDSNGLADDFPYH